MKDFLKWLGVNDKIAKVVVWIFIIMVMLIIINMALDSIGFPHYQITYDNLKKIDTNKALKYLMSWITILLNFYATIFLIFRVKEFKNIFKFSILYLALNIIIEIFFNFGILQVFILLFMVLFSYLYSNRNKKYILYAIIAMVINTLVQGIAYIYKAKLLNFASLNETTQMILSIDYFIIMGIIILVKEIYLKKRSDFNGT